MDTIGVITLIFLPITQTFIYDEITAIKNYNVVALTLKSQNESCFPFKKLYVAKSNMTAIREFSNIIKKEKIKLIHFQFGTSALYLLGLKKICHLPIVVTFHGFDASYELKNKYTLNKYREKLFPTVDHVIAVSQKLKNNLVNAGCPEHKITVLSGGIDVEKFSYMPRTINENEPVKILCVARLTEKKGLEYLIDSFAKVAKERPNTELLIVGQGELKDKLEYKISELGLKDKAKITDYVPHDEIPNIMHNHHIFCLPSVTSSQGDEEGLPTVLKEAMATGMPVVSTYHSGIPELIQDGKNGLLVAEKDVNNLADRLIYLIDHPEVCEEIGQRARKHIEENFNKYKQSEKLEKIYYQLLKNHVRNMGTRPGKYVVYKLADRERRMGIR